MFVAFQPTICLAMWYFLNKTWPNLLPKIKQAVWLTIPSCNGFAKVDRRDSELQAWAKYWWKEGHVIGFPCYRQSLLVPSNHQSWAKGSSPWKCITRLNWFQKAKASSFSLLLWVFPFFNLGYNILDDPKPQRLLGKPVERELVSRQWNRKLFPACLVPLSCCCCRSRVSSSAGISWPRFQWNTI